MVYDSIGATTYHQSLKSLRRRGLLVCFGTSSGPIPPIDAMQLAIHGSVFVTRPALADYIADPAERAELAGELFDHVGSGRIKIQINQRYGLEDAVAAHRDLEAGAGAVSTQTRTETQRSTGLMVVMVVAMLATAALAVGTGIHIYRVGDAGAHAVWQDVGENLK